MSTNNTEIENRLWGAADELRANSKLKSSEYSVPVLGLIFLRYADHKFTLAQKELEGKGTGRRTIGKLDYQARGVMYLPQKARFSSLLSRPEGENIGKQGHQRRHEGRRGRERGPAGHSPEDLYAPCEQKPG